MGRVGVDIVREFKALALQGKPPDSPELREGKRLAAKIIGLVQDGRMMANNWAFYLFNHELDSEPELRNKITAIVVSGLLDTVQSEGQVLDSYKAEAESKGYKNMSAWCDRAREWCVAAQDVLRLFSREEQLFIQDMRNGLVHGWLHKTQRDNFRVKYFDGEKIVTEQIEREEYLDTIKAPLITVRDGNLYFERGFDDALAEFTARFVDAELNYWKIVSRLNEDGFMDHVLEQIYSDIGVQRTSEFHVIPEIP